MNASSNTVLLASDSDNKPIIPSTYAPLLGGPGVEPPEAAEGVPGAAVNAATVEVSKLCSCCRCAAQSPTCTRWSRNRTARSLSAGATAPTAGAGPVAVAPNNAAAEEVNNSESRGEFDPAPPNDERPLRLPLVPLAPGGSFSFGMLTAPAALVKVRPGLLPGVRGVFDGPARGVRAAEAVEGREVDAAEAEEGVFGRCAEALVLLPGVFGRVVGVFGLGVVGEAAGGAEEVPLDPGVRCADAERLRAPEVAAVVDAVEARDEVEAPLTLLAGLTDRDERVEVEERTGFLLDAREEGRVGAREDAAVVAAEAAAAAAASEAAEAVVLLSSDRRDDAALVVVAVDEPNPVVRVARRFTPGGDEGFDAAAEKGVVDDEVEGARDDRLERNKAVAAATAAGGAFFFCEGRFGHRGALWHWRRGRRPCSAAGAAAGGGEVARVRRRRSALCRQFCRSTGWRRGRSNHACARRRAR